MWLEFAPVLRSIPDVSCIYVLFGGTYERRYDGLDHSGDNLLDLKVSLRAIRGAPDADL